MNLTEKIASLNRSQVIEAATSFSNIITNGQSDPEAEKLAASIKINPAQHLEEVEELSRIILLNAADDEEYRDIVEEVVDNAGQKQIILGGLEIVALAVAGVAALKIIFNPLKKKTTTIRRADGSTEQTEETHDASTGFLSDVYKSLFGKFGK